MNDLLEKAEALVQQSIGGQRKGSTEPSWLHSARVAAALSHHGFSEDVVLAGWLHDVVEDGGISLEDLQTQGFSARVVRLVDLSSHEMHKGDEPRTTLEKDARWARMVARLEMAADRDAWAVKVADLTDNLRGCVTLAPDRQAFFYEVKAPTYLTLAAPLLRDSSLYAELLEVATARGVERFRALL
jgi:GTP diphosphokinase / guanosine-3',5'-bis(diphosphate) 3'-diphosphatase